MKKQKLKVTVYDNDLHCKQVYFKGDFEETSNKLYKLLNKGKISDYMVEALL